MIVATISILTMALAALAPAPAIQPDFARESVTPPEAVYRAAPSIPKSVKRDRLPITVVINLIVDADGNVKDPRVVKSQGADLDEAALAAAKQWKFKPGTKDGRPVAVYAVIEITFRP